MKKVPVSVWIMALVLIGVLALVGLTIMSQKQTFADVKLPVEITEYFDYECPHCAAFYPTLKQIEAEYGDKVKVTYKNYAFLHEPSFAEDSTVYANAAEAAREQDKYVEFHDAILSKYVDVLAGKAQYSDMDVTKFAEVLKLDLVKFEADRNSDVVKARVAADKAEAGRLGVTSTPTVFIYGKDCSTLQGCAIGTVNSSTGAVDYSTFTKFISQMVAKAESNTNK